MSKNYKFETLQVHAGQEHPDPATDARAVPIYATTSYVFKDSAQAAGRFGLTEGGNIYSRLMNPTSSVFEERVAALEGGAAALATATGSAAITYAVQNIATAGDHIVSSAHVYGGTYNLFANTLKEQGISVTFVDPSDPENFRKAIQPNTKLLYGETLGNPNSDVLDLEAVSAIAHENGIPLIVDSTTSTPYLLNPIQYGADVVVHSTSKYINGSGDAISGIIIDSGNFSWSPERYPGMKEYKKYGKFAYLVKLRNGIWRNMGGCLAPMNAYLNIIGMETLGLRMERVCNNAFRLAQALEKLEGVSVNYPLLESSPYHELAEKQLSGKGGAILTIRAGSKERAYKLINHLKYVKIATNIGDVRTLVIHPASTIYIHSTPEAMEEAGVYDDTIRISVGIEDIKDLIQDFTEAVESLGEE